MAELGEATIESAETPPTEWVHPLDQPQVKSFLKENLDPTLFGNLVDSTRPTLSANPDQLELKEADAVKKSRLQGDYEETGSFVARTLYEETFGVMPAATLGGILSHHFREIHYDNHHINPNAAVEELSAIEKDVLSLPAEQALEKVHNIDIIEVIGNLGIPANDLYGSFHLEDRIYDSVVENPASILRSPKYGHIFQRGWLFLRCLSAFTQKLSASCKDKRILEEYSDFSRIKVLISAWQNLGSVKGGILTEAGTFKKAGDPGFQDGLKKLAVLRSSPDFAFLYKHFSALGSLKENPRIHPRGEYRFAPQELFQN